MPPRQGKSCIPLNLAFDWSFACLDCLAMGEDWWIIWLIVWTVGFDSDYLIVRLISFCCSGGREFGTQLGTLWLFTACLVDCSLGMLVWSIGWLFVHLLVNACLWLIIQLCVWLAASCKCLSIELFTWSSDDLSDQFYAMPLRKEIGYPIKAENTPWEDWAIGRWKLGRWKLGLS